MKKIGLIIAICALSSIQTYANKNSACDNFKNASYSQTELIKNLENSDLEFTQTFEIPSARGIQKVSYYYCQGKGGFLLVKFHDKELLYKEVPLNVWFEFRFTDPTQSFYIKQIKYNYISM